MSEKRKDNKGRILRTGESQRLDDGFVLNLVKKEDFGYRQIRDIKVSDAQQWIMKLHPDRPLPRILRVKILICRETKGNQVETCVR